MAIPSGRPAHDDDLTARLAAAGCREDGPVLQFAPGAEPSAVRVEDGIVLVCRGGAWGPADPATVLAWFADDSPIATWVRRRGADLMQLVLGAFGRPAAR